MSFQDNLKRYREKAGFSAKDFAKEIGCAYTTYLTYENQGREPKYELLVKIATVLHVSIDNLLDYDPTQPDELIRYITLCKTVGFSIKIERDGVFVWLHDTYVSGLKKEVFVRTVKETLHDERFTRMKNDALCFALQDNLHSAWRRSWLKFVSSSNTIKLTKEQQEKIRPWYKAYVEELKKHPNSEDYIEHFGAPGYIYEKKLKENPDSEEYKEYFGTESDSKTKS